MLRHVSSRLRRIVPACLGLLLLGATMPAIPRRIVSLNMCADQLVIALADRCQIAGVTEWARDPALSYYAAAARALPITHRGVEEIVALRPDLVIGATSRTKTILAPLEARGLRMVELPPADGLAGIEAAIATIAGAVGHPDRGRALIARMRDELARTGLPPGRGRIAAYYQRSGYLTGTGTLVDEIMRRAGLVNLAARLGRPALSQLGLEQMALARPDFLVMDGGTRIADARGSAMLHHPLLDRAVPPSHRLYVPEAMTVCGTPAYPRAVALLIAQIRAADRADRLTSP